MNVSVEAAPPSCQHSNDLVKLNYKMTLPYSLCDFDSKNATFANWCQVYTAPNDSSIVYAGKGTALQRHLPSSTDRDSESIIGDGGVPVHPPPPPCGIFVNPQPPNRRFTFA